MAKKLLLADDSITIQKVVGITFAQEDFDITYVDNGVDAINKAQTIKPDIVLADIVMPQKNGYDVCEAIKKNADLKHIPVLLLAGTFETFDVNRGKLVGADDYIIKPFESQALIDKVNSLLQGKAAPTSKPVAAPVKPAPIPPIAVAEATDSSFSFDTSGTFDLGGADLGSTDMGVAETTESFAAVGSEKIEMASAAEMVMDQMSSVSNSSISIDLPESALGLGADMGVVEPAAAAQFTGGIGSEFGLDTPMDQGKDLGFASIENSSASGDFGGGFSDAGGLDLPPIADGASAITSDYNEASYAPPAAVAAPTMPAISEAEVREIIEAKVQEIIEKIAWEVIPGLAERMILDEIRRLTTAVDSPKA